MKKRSWIISAWLIVMGGQTAIAAEQVWRYVDPQTGKVTYSNVQVKGQKGSKVEIMDYPVQEKPPVTPTGSGLKESDKGKETAVPIPSDVLKKIQSGDLSGLKLPNGLPPLPSLPGEKQTPAQTVTPPVNKDNAASSTSKPVNEPKWAKEVDVKEKEPAWARDPFSQR